MIKERPDDQRSKNQNINIPHNKETSQERKEGKEREREFFIPILKEKEWLGDVFELVVHTSKEVDGDLGDPKELKKLKEKYEEEGNSEEVEKIKKTLNLIYTSPKVDILLKFRKDGSYLAIQTVKLEKEETRDQRGRDIYNDKKYWIIEHPTSTVEEIGKDNEDGVDFRGQDEEILKLLIVFDFDEKIRDDINYFLWEYKKTPGNIAPKRQVDFIHLRRDEKDEKKRQRVKEYRDLIIQKEIIEEFVGQLKESLEGWKCRRCRSLKEKVESQIKILEEAKKTRVNNLLKNYTDVSKKYIN